MSEIGFTRAQRRQLNKLADKVGRITQADRMFFERRPDRQHRVRIASQAEIEQEVTMRVELAVPSGFRLFTAVKNISPGHRLRILVCGTEGSETDLTEAEALWIFEMALAGTGVRYV